MEIQAELNANEELVATFPESISNDQLSRADLTIRYCEHIKVWIPGEAFWMTKERKDHTFYYGVVDNHLIHTLDDYAWCKFGADVKWNLHWDKLYPWDREKDPIFDDDDSDADTCQSDAKLEDSIKCACCDKDVFRFSAPVCKGCYLLNGFDREVLSKSAIDDLNEYIKSNPLLELELIDYSKE